jgi:hypothetical protein
MAGKTFCLLLAFSKLELREIITEAAAVRSRQEIRAYNLIMTV